MTEGIKRIHGILVLQPYLRYEERIVGQVVFCHPRPDTLVVDVDTQYVNGRCSAMPQVYEVCQRTSRWILSRLATSAVESHIDVHRQIVDLTSCLGYLLHVCGVSPRLKDLLRIDIVTKQLRPVSVSFCLWLQFLFQIRVQRLLMRLQIVRQLLRHSTVVHTRGIIRIVARHLYHTYLVLHLHHDNRLFMSIVIAQMSHHLTEGTLVGLQYIPAQ